MFNLSLGVTAVMLALLVIFLGPQKLPALVQRFRRRPGRNGFVRPAHEVQPLSRLDWMLMGAGLALLFAVSALLAHR